MMMNSNPSAMRVILGVSSLKAYVTAPKAFQVLGIVRFGMEYGLLATDPAGHYFRVNGSQVVALQSDDVHRAIDFSYGVGGRYAAGAANYAAAHPNAMPVPVSVPKVVIRKHRQVLQSDFQSRHIHQSANA